MDKELINGLKGWKRDLIPGLDDSKSIILHLLVFWWFSLTLTSRRVLLGQIWLYSFLSFHLSLSLILFSLFFPPSFFSFFFLTEKMKDFWQKLFGPLHFFIILYFRHPFKWICIKIAILSNVSWCHLSAITFPRQIKLDEFLFQWFGLRVKVPQQKILLRLQSSLCLRHRAGCLTWKHTACCWIGDCNGYRGLFEVIYRKRGRDSEG